MPAKPTELKKIIALLDEEAPSAEWLATEIFNMVEEMLINREQYILMVRHKDEDLIFYQAIGPWYSKAKMNKEWQKYAAYYNSDSKGAFAELKHMSKIKV